MPLCSDLECFQRGQNSYVYAVGFTNTIDTTTNTTMGRLLGLNLNRGDSICNLCYQAGLLIVNTCVHCHYSIVKTSFDSDNSFVSRFVNGLDLIDCPCESDEGHHFRCGVCGNPDLSKSPSKYNMMEEKLNCTIDKYFAKHPIYNMIKGTDDSSNVIQQFADAVVEEFLLTFLTGGFRIRAVHFEHEDGYVLIPIYLYAFNGGRFDTIYCMYHLTEPYQLNVKDGSPLYGSTHHYLSAEYDRDITNILSRDQIQWLLRDHMCAGKMRMKPKPYKLFMETLVGYKIRLIFRDDLRYTAPNSLNGTLKDCGLPSEYLKGDLDHELVRDWDTVQEHQSKWEPYLYRDVIGMTLWHCNLQADYKREMRYTLKGKTFCSNMPSELTLPGLAYKYFMGKAKELNPQFQAMCLKDEDGVKGLKNFVRASQLGGKVEVYRNRLVPDVDELSKWIGLQIEGAEMVVGSDWLGSMALYMGEYLKRVCEGAIDLVYSLLHLPCKEGGCECRYPTHPVMDSVTYTPTLTTPHASGTMQTCPPF